MTAYGSKQLAASFRVVRKNTLQIAEDIPESQYAFVAAPGARPVSQMLAHIALVPRVWIDIHGTKKLRDMKGYDHFGVRKQIVEDEQKPRSKAEVLDLLRAEGESYASFLDGLSDEVLAETVTQPDGEVRSRLEAILSAKEHEMHHRSQLMLIERLLGVEPHLTRQRNALIAELMKAKA